VVLCWNDGDVDDADADDGCDEWRCVCLIEGVRVW